jgi:hypothetical protein
MPNVNGKKFAYTAKGMAAAKKEAAKMGVKKPTSKKQVIPPDYDVILPGMGYTKPKKNKPPKKIKKK